MPSADSWFLSPDIDIYYIMCEIILSRLFMKKFLFCRRRGAAETACGDSFSESD